MSYDLYFLQPESGAPVSVEALSDWFSSRDGYQVSEHGARFTDPTMGFEFHFGFRSADGEDAPLELIISGPRPHLLGEAMEPEVRAVVERFGLRVNDPQMEGMGRGAYSREKFVAGWSFFNRFVHQVMFGHIGNPPPPTLPAARWEAMWRWNRGKEALADGDRVFLPTVQLGVVGGRAITWLTLVGPITTRLPEVDYVMTLSAGGLKLVPYSKLALAQFARAEEPAPHHVIDDPDAAFAESLTRAEAAELQRAAADALLTEELVREAVASVKGKLDEEGQIQAAVKAFNQCDYAETLRLCEGISGDYADTAEELRAYCLGELGRYDECQALYQKVLAREADDPMYWNSLAYFLVGAGRDEEARRHYAHALELLEPLLAGEPEEPEDLWSRKAYALIGLARPKEAKAAAQKSLSLDKKHFFATLNLGRAAIALGDAAGAKKAMASAHKLRPASPYPHFYDARILAAEGKKAAAQKALQRAVEKAPHLGNLARRDPLLSKLLLA